MNEHRLERLGNQIREEIASLIFSGKIKDSRVSPFLSIVRVEVSSDLSFAKVYVSGFQNAHTVKKGVAGFESAKGFIQSVMGKKFRIRMFPKLAFFFDESPKEAFDMVRKIDSLMASAQAQRAESSADAKSDCIRDLPE